MGKMQAGSLSAPQIFEAGQGNIEDRSALDILCACADAALEQAMTGEMQAGHNGPHFDPETPLRNTAHWAILYARLAELTGQENYRTPAERLLDRLLSDTDIARNKVPVFRKKQGKDRTNGVIGLGWLVESLAITGRILGKSEALDRASRLVHANVQLDDRDLFRLIDEKGALMPADTTFNHQIWMALGIAEIAAVDETCSGILDKFLRSLDKKLAYSQHGYLAHHLPGLRKREVVRDFIFRMLDIVPVRNAATASALKKPFGKILKQYEYTRSKEVGYLSFTLHALARIADLGFAADTIAKLCKPAIDQTLLSAYMDAISDNQWAYPYNPPGFEYPRVAVSFLASGCRSEALNTARRLFRHQIECSFDPHTGSMSNNTPDPVTATARLYPLALLEKDTLSLL